MKIKVTGENTRIGLRGQLALVGVLVMLVSAFALAFFASGLPAATNTAEPQAAAQAERAQPQEMPFPSGFEQVHAGQPVQEEPYPAGFEQAHTLPQLPEQPYPPGFEQTTTGDGTRFSFACLAAAGGPRKHECAD